MILLRNELENLEDDGKKVENKMSALHVFG